VPPPLKKIDEGKGKGQYLLPVKNTARSVDLDLINNIMRLPYRQRLSLIVSELGTGLAGRGTEVNQVVRRADPALKEVDEVLRLLASQNRVLADLARNSDTTLAPLARERKHVSSFIDHSSEVAQATAERRDDLEADIERLPRFLQELKPTMRRIAALSDEATPVFSDLGDAAPDVNRLVTQLGPFSTAATPALKSLGEAGEIGIPAMRDARPVIADLGRLASISRPVGRTARQVLESFKKGRGVERLLDYVFYQVAAVNGYDSFGHYLRARLILNTCSRYYTRPVSGCSSRFAASANATQAVSAQAAAAQLPKVTATPQPAAAAKRVKETAPAKRAAPAKLVAPAKQAAPAKETAPARQPAAPGQPSGGEETTGPLMDYLFGKDSG
jgi:phospholipid/cholesterol/gamma-HCH transport system substrate-binding protein